MKNPNDFSTIMRETIGFERVADLLDRAMSSQTAQVGYPPYNIEKTGEETYRISVAVAGFAPDELSVEAKDRSVVVSGKKNTGEKEGAGEEAAEADGRTFLHRGIALRPFERTFQLADHVKVKDATIEHGLLHIDLALEIPEDLKPRSIKIKKAGKA